jgi:aspartate carbamoyltransferase catalytic subunit
VTSPDPSTAAAPSGQGAGGRNAGRYPAGALAFPHRDLLGIGVLATHEILFLLDEAEQ